MVSAEADAVLAAIEKHDLDPYADDRRILLVSRQPGPEDDVGLTMILREVCSDQRIRDRFRGDAAWLTGGAESADARTFPLLHQLWYRWLFDQPQENAGFLAVDDLRSVELPRVIGRRLYTVIAAVTTADPVAPGPCVDVIEVDTAAAAHRARAWLTDRLRRLPADAATRLAELGVLAASQMAPMPGTLDLTRRLWRLTAVMTDGDTDTLVRALTDHGLIHLAGTDQVQLDPVVRALMRTGRPASWFADLSNKLLDAAAPLVGAGTAWWQMEVGDHYLWDNLIAHLVEAGRQHEAELLAVDPRWMATRLRHSGPMAPARDLATVARHGAAAHLWELFAEFARKPGWHQDGGTAEVYYDSLLARLQFHEWWGPQARLLQDTAERPILVHRWRPGPFTSLSGFPLSPDGALIAVGAGQDEVCLLDTVSGRVVRRLRGTGRHVEFGSDGSWLVLHHHDGGMPWIRVWKGCSVTAVYDVATGARRFRKRGYREGAWGLRQPCIWNVAVPPSGTHIFAIPYERADGVRAWDWTTRRRLSPGSFDASMSGWRRPELEATSPDEAWHAQIDDFRELRLRDLRTDRPGPAIRLDDGLHWIFWLPDSSGLAVGGANAFYLLSLRSAGPDPSR